MFPAFLRKGSPPSATVRSSTDVDAPAVDPAEAPAAPAQATVPAGDADAGPEAVQAHADAIDPNAPARDLRAEKSSGEGIWTWVDRLEGEIPSDEQVAALREAAEVVAEERGMVDGLTAPEAPTAFYADPAAALAVDPLFLDLVDPSEFDIPVEVNPSVEKWVRYFTGNGRKHYAKWLARSTRYRPMMLRELEAEGLPRDLVYLSMIESGYNAHAYSHAAAAGLWQFIPSTGKLYDLRIDYWVDERRDPEESLDAAMAFLGELHTMFGDWRLAWAAYNTGPGRIRRATRNADSKDFWVLADGPHLHPETDNYVPKIMAAAIIGKHPERYGFTGIDYQSELEYDVVRVDGSVELEVLARCAGATVDEIKWLNPALRRYATPPEGHDVRVPVGRRDTFTAALARVPASERVTVARHTVRRGETLSIIAAKYGSSVSSVSKANNLKNVNRIYVGMSLVIPRSGSTPTVARNTSSSSKSNSKPAPPKVHTVRRGDTLSGIATRYGVSLTNLKAYNGISGSTIRPGEKLALTGSGGGTARASATHVVQRGETLSGIAAKYGMSQSQLQSANGIRNASHITVGQKLKVQGGSSSESSWTTHTVRNGDSLGKIATRYGCSVGDLQSWNSIRGSTIHPGQKLKVRAG